MEATRLLPCGAALLSAGRDHESGPVLQVHPTASHGGILFDPAFLRELLMHVEAAVHDRPCPPVQSFAPPTCELLRHPAVASQLKVAANEVQEASQQLHAVAQQLQRAAEVAEQPAQPHEPSDSVALPTRTQQAAAVQQGC